MNKFLSNSYKFTKQKNTLSIIGEKTDFIDIFSFSNILSLDFLNKNLNYKTNGLITKDNYFTLNTDFPFFYRTNTILKKNNFFNNVLIIGSNPRLENSNLQLFLRNLTEETPTNIMYYNNFFNTGMKNKFKGTSNNSFYTIFQGKEKSIKQLFFYNTKNLIINGINKNNTKLQNCNNFQTQYLNLKFYNFDNSSNLFLNLSSDLSSLINNEYNFLNSSKNITNFLIKDLNNKTNHENLLNIKLPKFNKNKEITFNIFNHISKENFYSKNVKNFHYIHDYTVKDNLLLNFSGLYLKGNKVITNQNKKSHSLLKYLNIKTSLYILENNYKNFSLNLYNYNFIKNKKSLNKIYLETKFKHNIFYKKFFNKMSIYNLFIRNVNRKFFTFWWFSSLSNLSNKLYFYNYTNSIKDYYLDNNNNKDDNNMLLFSLLHGRWNKPF